MSVTAYDGPVGGPYTPDAIDYSGVHGSGGTVNVTATVEPISTVSTPTAAPTEPLVATDTNDSVHTDPNTTVVVVPVPAADPNVTVVEVPVSTSTGVTVTASLGDTVNSYSIPIAIDASSIPGSGGVANVTATVDPIATVSTPPAAPTGPLVYNDGGSNEEYYSSHGDYMDGCFDNG